jgi:hypothetical protein
MAGSIDVLAIEDYVVWPNQVRDSSAKPLRDEKLFLAIELLKPIVKTWIQGRGMDQAVSLCHRTLVEKLDLRITKDEFTILGRVFQREEGMVEEEILVICRELLASNIGVLDGLPLARGLSS